MSSTSPTHGAPVQRSAGPAAPSNPGQVAQTFVAQQTWPGFPTQLVAIPMPAPSSAPPAAAPMHGQAPPSYTPSHPAPILGLVSADGSNVAGSSPPGEQYVGIQQQNVLSGPSPGYMFPSHNSVGVVSTSSHQSMSRLPTSFSQPNLASERSNVMRGQAQRRESVSFGRPGANGGNMGRSPSVVRISNRPSSGGPAMDSHNKGAFNLPHQPQSRPNLPHLQLGFTKFNPEGHSQMQWMANHPHYPH